MALTKKGQATRDRIVAAAADLMYANGVAATSTEQVQARAGVSASQIYHYFADKKSLIAAVIAHQTEFVLDTQEPWLIGLDSVAALCAWRDFVVAMQQQRNCEGGCPIGSFVGELAETDADARAALAAAYQRWQDAIRDGIAAMRDRGEIRSDTDPDRAALAMLAALQGGLLLCQTTRSTAALEAALDTMIAAICR